MVFALGHIAFAQTKLTSQDVIALALEHNFDIKMSNKAIEMSKNNAALLNSGYLPTLRANGNASIERNDTEGQLANGDTRIAEGVETRRYSASLDINYTLFDGLGRFYNYKRLKEQQQLTELQARETIENTVLQLHTIYYSVAQFLENIETLETALNISEERLLRANYQFEYGQASKLNVLNAKVDVSNDSIALLDARQQLDKAKRDLNFIIGQDTDKQFDIDKEVHFLITLRKDDFINKAKKNNVKLLQAEKGETISQYTVKSNTARFLPTIGLVGSYGWNELSNNSPLAFLLQNTSNGLTGGVNISWNLFDGGSAITQTKNAKIELEVQHLRKAQILLEVERNVNNAWYDYKNKLEVLDIRERQIYTAQRNFNRTLEQFKLGRINSIEFRQAQLNLTRSKLSRNQAKYQAKMAELTVLQMAGDLLNVEF